MNTITITLSDDRLERLQELAARFNVSPEEPDWLRAHIVLKG